MIARVDAIVLAAGASRRMGEGRQKLLMEVDGQPMIRHAVGAAVRSTVGEVIVVTGEHHDQLLETLGDFATVRFTRNANPADGMLSSVRLGLEALDPMANGAAVLLGDQPGIDSGMIDSVIEGWRRSPLSIAVPIYRERRGHPLVFDVRHRDAVLNQYDDVGLRGLLLAHAGEVLEVPLESKEVLEDIDTPEDYEQRTSRLNSKF